MEKEKVIQYWRESAQRDLGAARDLIKLKHYNWALFVYHLAIEKLLKGQLVKSDKEIPPIHKLVRLAELSGLKITGEDRDNLLVITDFNLEARYDDYKENFYRKATKEFTQKWSDICERIYLWIDKQF